MSGDHGTDGVPGALWGVWSDHHALSHWEPIERINGRPCYASSQSKAHAWLERQRRMGNAGKHDVVVVFDAAREPPSHFDESPSWPQLCALEEVEATHDDEQAHHAVQYSLRYRGWAVLNLDSGGQYAEHESLRLTALGRAVMLRGRALYANGRPW